MPKIVARKFLTFGLFYYLQIMKRNPQTLLIESLKAEGLNIVDKRGIKFKDEHERNMLWEGELLVDWYKDYLSNIEFETDDWNKTWQEMVRDFRRDISAQKTLRI